MGKLNSNFSDGVIYSKIFIDRVIWKESDEKWYSKDVDVFYLYILKYGWIIYWLCEDCKIVRILRIK